MKTFVALLFLSLPLLSFAQGQHELKLNILSSMDKNPKLLYEYHNGKKLGFEVLMGYLERGLVVGRASVPPLLDFQAFPRHFLIMGTALRYYVEPNTEGKGAHFGVYARGELKVSEKEGYTDAFREYFGEDPSLERANRLNIGALMGYKWVISNHWIIEPQIRYGWNAVKPASLQDLSGEILLSLGYRF